MSEPRQHLRALAEALPPGAAVPVPREWLLAVLAEPKPETADTSWRSRIWKVPADTVLTTAEAAEALGKSKGALHKMVRRHRLPFTRAAGGYSPIAGAPLLFRAADLRRYLEGKKAA
jgi:excisionase family DNA binding protein